MVASRSCCCVVSALVVIAGLSRTVAQAPVKLGARGLYGLPSRLRELRDLNLIDNRSKLGPLPKMEVVLAWLADEIREPSVTTKGIGGGPIDSDYIQQQLIIALGSVSDPVALDWLLGRGDIEHEGIRDALRLALAGRGDQRQIKPLIAMLKADPSPGHRYLAAERLGFLGSADAVPTLEEALKDTYSVQVNPTFISGETTLYPVRRVADESLRRLRDPAALSSYARRADAFSRQLAAGRGALAHKRPALHRLVLAANGKLFANRKVEQVPGKMRSGKRAK